MWDSSLHLSGHRSQYTGFSLAIHQWGLESWGGVPWNLSLPKDGKEEPQSALSGATDKLSWALQQTPVKSR